MQSESGWQGGSADRRAKRTPVMLELAGFLSRGAEWATVLVVGLAGIWITYPVFHLEPVDQYVRVAWLSSVAYALVAELIGCYDLDARFTLRNGWMRVIPAWLGCCVLMLTSGFFLKISENFSRGWVLAWVVSVALALVVVRGGATMLLRDMKRKGVFNQRLAIYGAAPQSERLGEAIAANRQLTLDLVGRYGCADELADAQRTLPCRGDLDRLIRDIRAARVDQIIIALPLPPGEDAQAITNRLSMLPVLVRLAPDLSSFALPGSAMVMLGDLPLLTLFERPINGTDQILKRIEDLVIGSLLLLAFAPFLAIIAAAIKLDSRGPVFFRQPREGFNHQTFRIWKFRSMRTDLLEYDDIRQATQGDPRVTKVGRILRATSLDELPQLFNVMLGEMSLVGPRPHAPSTRVGAVLFNDVANNYAARHRVKPGMTGWAQINGWRGETDTDEKLLKRIECDLFYIERWSITLDLYIIVRTVAAVLFPKSAY